MTSKQSYSDSSANRINAVLNGRKSITFRELKKKANVSNEELEDFLLPLLGEKIIGGKLEVRCPDCGADLGSYSKYTDVPRENDCEICGHSNPFSDNCLEIVLEVKDDFFRVVIEPEHLMKKHYANEELHALLKSSIMEKDETTKGKLFENFFRIIAEREDDFELLKPHARSDIGEFDFVYKSKSNSNHTLWNECKYLFIECKNRKDVVSSKEMNQFVSMLSKKAVFKSARIGIYITTKRFSPQANNVAKAGIGSGLIIFRIAYNDITKLIEKGLKPYLEEQFDELMTKI